MYKKLQYGIYKKAARSHNDTFTAPMRFLFPTIHRIPDNGFVPYCPCRDSGFTLKSPFLIFFIRQRL